MRFQICSTGRHLWTWILLDEADATVLESDRAFPSRTQASAAAMAFAQLVARAGRSLNGGPPGSLI
jgi:hypothetical protein